MIEICKSPIKGEQYIRSQRVVSSTSAVKEYWVVAQESRAEHQESKVSTVSYNVND